MCDKKFIKSNLTDTIQREHSKLEVMLANFTNTEKNEPFFDNGWSIKDMIAHISSWERVGYDIVQAAQKNKPLKLYISKAFENVDKYNAETFKKKQETPIDQIETEFKASYLDFLTLIDTLSDNFIVSNLPFNGAEHLTIQNIITSNTYIHYREHTKELIRLENSKR